MFPKVKVFDAVARLYEVPRYESDIRGDGSAPNEPHLILRSLFKSLQVYHAGL